MSGWHNVSGHNVSGRIVSGRIVSGRHVPPPVCWVCQFQFAVGWDLMVISGQFSVAADVLDPVSVCCCWDLLSLQCQFSVAENCRVL